jgi:hypothetical protein
MKKKIDNIGWKGSLLISAICLVLPCLFLTWTQGKMGPENIGILPFVLPLWGVFIIGIVAFIVGVVGGIARLFKSEISTYRILLIVIILFLIIACVRMLSWLIFY